MRFLFTKSSKFGSRLIRSYLSEPVSHFALELSLPSGAIVVESRLEDGVQLRSPTEFFRANSLVYSRRCRTLLPSDLSFDGIVYQELLRQVGSEYDYKAFAFWAATLISKRAFGSKLPDKNRWGTRGAHTCVEILRGVEPLIDDRFVTSLKSVDLEMTSPFRLYQLLGASPYLV